MSFYTPLETSAKSLAVKHDFSQVAVVGRYSFKMFSIKDNEFKEVFTPRSGKSRINTLDLLDFNNVVWNPINENILATAATSGAVVIWNLLKAGRSNIDCSFKDNERGVNKVTFQPSEAHHLISGAIDGVMKLYDLRIPKAVSTFLRFKPNEFCIGVNNGMQFWDIRRTDCCEFKITGHAGDIKALDWHPDIRRKIATANNDKKIEIWDVPENCQNNITPSISISTVGQVSKIRWQPDTQYEIASCGRSIDGGINVWNTRRPYIPCAKFSEKDETYDISWISSNNLLSAGKVLYCYSFSDAYKPVDAINSVGLDISASGDLCSAVPHRLKDDTPNFISSRASVVSRKNTSNYQTMISYFGSDFNILKERDYASNLSAEYIIKSALNYKLQGHSLAEIMEHNSHVAENLRRPQVSLTWLMLDILYQNSGSFASKDESKLQSDLSYEYRHRASVHYLGDSTDTRLTCHGTSAEDETETDEDNLLTNIASGMTSNHYFFGDGEINPVEFNFEDPNYIDTNLNWTIPEEAFKPKSDILHQLSPPQKIPFIMQNNDDNTDVMLFNSEMPLLLGDIKPIDFPEWDFRQFVVEMLRYYASAGDTQMAVICYIVLGERIKDLLNNDEVEQWFVSYIDILHRLQLWNAANEIMQHARNFPFILQANQQSTGICLQCGSCGRNLPTYSLLCINCKSYSSKCSVCHRVVKGLYAWCQGCSHGGHLQHIIKWMKTHTNCPAGCGHLCQFY